MAASPPAGVEDILHHILAHLAADLKVTSGVYFDPPVSKSARQAVGRLARAHSTFTLPALGILWRYLRGDWPLLHLLRVVGIARLLPRTDSRNPSRWGAAHFEICGTPATDGPNWTRFQEYASLVREITLDPFVQVHDEHVPGISLQETFWHQLMSVLGAGTVILPRLEVGTLLSLAMPSRFDVLEMGPLYRPNPSISQLNIVFPQIRASEAGTELQQILSALLSSLPNLKSLSVRVPASVLDLESLPQSHPHLRRLELDPGFKVDSDHLRIIASLPNLEHLSISLSDHASPNRSIAFPTLRSLEVSSYEFSVIGPLISHAKAPQLQAFSFSETHEDSDATCKELPIQLRTLVAKWPRLTALRWHSTYRGFSHPGGASCKVKPTLAELVAPLLSLRALRRFSACLQGLFVAYPSADLRAMAEAWPGLETFELRLLHQSGSNMSDAGTAARCVADLESIVCFARHCPRLHSLRIPTMLFFEPNVDSDASFTAVDARLPAVLWRRWPCTVFVDHILCPGEHGRDHHREARLKAWMQKVLPHATLSFPLMFQLSRGLTT